MDLDQNLIFKKEEYYYGSTNFKIKIQGDNITEGLVEDRLVEDLGDRARYEE